MTEYGGSAESFAWWRGQLVPGARMVLWSDRDRSAPITDLVTAQGEPITDGFVRADDAGWYRFATVGEYQTIYGEILGGDGRLYRIDRADVGSRVFGVEADVQAVGGVARQAAEDAIEAVGKADAAHGLITEELGRVNQPEGLTRLNADGKVHAAHLPSHTEAFLTWGDYPTIGPDVWPTPVGFRGMGTHQQQGQAPENTVEGVRAYVDLHPLVPGQQVPVVWLNAVVANDGSTLIARGDPELAGDIPTLTKRIHPQDLTALTARTAQVSGHKWGAGWPNLSLPSLEDVFSEFAGRALFVLQVVRAGLVEGNLWRTVLNFGMEDSVLVCGDTDHLGITPGVERSRIMGLFEDTTATVGELEDLAAQGVDWVALNCSGVDPVNGVDQISAARAAGLKVMAYPLTRHYELDRCQQAGDQANPWGVEAIVTPDPVYCRWPKQDVSLFADLPGFGGYAPGHLGNGDGVDAPVRARPYLAGFEGTHAALHLTNDPTGSERPDQMMDPDGHIVFWEHYGWAYRSWYEQNQGQARLRVEVSYLFRQGPPTAWVCVGFGFSDDRPYRYQGTGTVVMDGPPGQNGWVLGARADGNLYLRRVTGGVLSSDDVASATTGGGGVVPGPWVQSRRVRVDLYPDRVEARLMNEFGSTVHRTLTYADSSAAHRGPYVSIGSRQSDLLILGAFVTAVRV